MENFTPWASLAGGILIGVSISVTLLVNGRIAGISGIVAGVLMPRPGDTSWRLVFVLGLLAGGGVLRLVDPASLEIALDRTIASFALAGLLVGFGTRLGNGCTSGHGVCGMSRGSVRSITATLTFMAFGVLSAWLAGHLLGSLL